MIDHVGKRFGKLLVLELAGMAKYGRLCLVQCDCGARKEILQGTLTRKIRPVKSCGCLRETNRFIKHGLSKHRFYRLLGGIKTRCYNPNSKDYPRYGGRGVRVCDEWMNDVSTFVAWVEKQDYKEGMQIDRIDNNGDYSPVNCRIATPSENCRNRRDNRYINIGGARRLLIEVAEEFDINYDVFLSRIHNSGMTPEAAVSFGRVATFQKL